MDDKKSLDNDLNQPTSAPVDAEAKKSGSLARPIALVVLLAVAVSLGWYFDAAELLRQTRNWIAGLGPLGPLVYILLYAAAVTVAMPASVLTVAAGALFGSVLGTIVVSVASTLGASLAFLIARYLARDSIARWLADKEMFQKLDRMTEKQGHIMVAITRLVPVFPFNLLNYGFGLTRVPFWTYVFWSWLCMLPGTVLYVVGADAVTQAIAKGEIPWALVAAVAATAVILTLLVRSARGKLKSEEEEI